MPPLPLPVRRTVIVGVRRRRDLARIFEPDRLLLRYVALVIDTMNSLPIQRYVISPHTKIRNLLTYRVEYSMLDYLYDVLLLHQAKKG